MKTEQCTVGVRVGWKAWGDSFYRGRIIAPVFKSSKGQELVVVEWDDNRGVQNMEVNTLLPEADVEREMTAAKAAKARYEQEFQRLSGEVKVKLNTAASLVKEAQALAATISKEARYMGDAADSFQEALDDSGWYVSSANC